MGKQEIFKEVLEGKSSYAIVKYNDIEELLWITCHNEFDNGEDWYLEAPNYLREFHGYDLSKLEDLKFLADYGMMIYEEKVYEIEAPQTSPFLPDHFEIELVDEQYALRYLVDKNTMK